MTAIAAAIATTSGTNPIAMHTTADAISGLRAVAAGKPAPNVFSADSPAANGAVRDYNDATQRFPDLAVARATGFRVEEFFEAGDAQRAAVRVEMP